MVQRRSRGRTLTSDHLTVVEVGGGFSYKF
jgi:hypothetical protein